MPLGTCMLAGTFMSGHARMLCSDVMDGLHGEILPSGPYPAMSF